MNDNNEYYFAQISEEMLKDENIGAMGIAVFASIWLHSNMKEGVRKSWPSTKTISDQTGLHRNTVRKQLSLLEKHGYLTIIRTMVDGKNLNNTYYPNPTPKSRFPIMGGRRSHVGGST